MLYLKSHNILVGNQFHYHIIRAKHEERVNAMYKKAFLTGALTSFSLVPPSLFSKPPTFENSSFIKSDQEALQSDYLTIVQDFHCAVEIVKNER